MALGVPILKHFRVRSSPFNRAQVACNSFVVGTASYGVPSRVRMDEGVENEIIRDFMVEVNGQDRGSAIMGKSVHNQRIERLWRDVLPSLCSHSTKHFMP